jgi:hypothetical protein
MARIETDPNYTSPTFSRATAGTDIFKKEDVQSVAAALSTHVHDGAGKGLAVADGSITLAKLAPNSVNSSKIVDGSIATVDLAPGACTGAALGSDVVKTTDAALTTWTDWSTPAISQGGAGITLTVNWARYKLVGKVAYVSFSLTVATVGTSGSGNPIQLTTLPIVPHNAGYNVAGSGVMLHASAFRVCAAVITSLTTVQFLIDNNANFVGAAPAFGLAVGDQVSANLFYEAQ